MDKPFKTDCHNCVFNHAIKTETPNCILGRYEIFEKRGSASDGFINELCTACRDIVWEDKANKDVENGLHNFTCNISEQTIRLELANVYSLIIYHYDGDVLEGLKKTLNSKQTLNPKQIIFVTTNTDVNISEITKILKDYVKGTSTEFLAMKIVEHQTRREAIDIAVKRCTGLMYTLIKNGETLEANALERLNDRINEKLEKIIYVKPYSYDSLTGMTIHLRFHQIVNGNVTKKIEEKLEEALALEEDKSFFRSWEEV